MKKVIYTLIGCLAIVLTTCVGIYIGTNIEVKQVEYKNVEAIAVVNLDEGVEYNGEERNFGTEFINQFSTPYVVTGYSEARGGVENGDYAGMIVIPSTFSTSVVNVDGVQAIEVFKFEISPNVSSSSREQAVTNAESFTNSFNQKISNMYITSILSNYHTAQDATDVVLKNDKKDEELIAQIETISTANFVISDSEYNFPDDVESFNMEYEENKGKEIIDNISTTYDEFSLATQGDLKVLTDANDTAVSNYTNTENAMNGVPLLINDDGTSNYNLDGFESYMDAVAAHNGTVVTNHNTDINDFITYYAAWEASLSAAVASTDVRKAQEKENEILMDVFKYAEANNITIADAAIDFSTIDTSLDVKVDEYFSLMGLKADATDIKTFVDYWVYYNDLSSTNNKNIQYSNAKNDIDSFISFYDSSKTSLLASLTLVNNPEKTVLDDPADTSLDGQLLTVSGFKGKQLVNDDLVSYNSLLKAHNTTSLTEFTEYISALKRSQKDLENFNMKEKLDTEKVDSLTSEYDSNIDTLNNKVQQFADSHEQYSEKLTSETEKYTLEIEKKHQEAVAELEREIETEISGIKSAKANNSVTNQELLGNFASSISYTRNGSLVNKSFVEFVSKPLNIDHTLTEQNKSNNTFDYTYLLIVGGVSILGMIVLFGLSKIKKSEE